MHFRIYLVVCWALLVGLTTAASQNTQRGNSGFTFKDSDADADIEGSGFDGEVNRDLESSGSGAGPDDEDNDDIPAVESNIPEVEIIGTPKKIPDIEKIPNINMQTEPSPTEDSSVVKNPKEDRPITSFFSQPGILAAVIGGAVVGLLCAILVVMFIVYRMRKKDEGSYALGEPKQSPNSNSYSRGNNKEFYA